MTNEISCPKCKELNKMYDGVSINCIKCGTKIYNKNNFDLPDNWDMALSGKRIQLIRTNDPYTNLKEGDLGTIEFVIKNNIIEDQISVQWDNGSNLMMLIGVDEYVILDEVDQIV